jgi:hypothetical protein
MLQISSSLSYLLTDCAVVLALGCRTARHFGWLLVVLLLVVVGGVAFAGCWWLLLVIAFGYYFGYLCALKIFEKKGFNFL